MAMGSLAVGAVSLVVPQPAHACSIAGPPPTEEELVARADLVFEGVAVSRRDPNTNAPLQSSGDPIIWTFLVDREIKGAAAQLQEVRSARSGATCGIAFELGTRYRVVATLVDGVFTTGLGSGTREAPATETTTTRAPPAGPPTTPPRAPPRPGRITFTG